MVRCQAGSLVEAGFAVVVPDLYGTGDSAGEFVDANWTVWRTDMCRLIEWVRGQGAASISFLGIRLGSLLAADVARVLDEGPDRLVFWQPVSDGKQAMNQFLRLNVAAEMMRGGQSSVGSLRESLDQGHLLEVAGYELSPDLVREIDQLKLEALVPRTCNLCWLEIVARKDKVLPLGSRKKVDELLDRGHRVETATVTGEAFWSTQEITRVPALIDTTTAHLSGATASRALPLVLDHEVINTRSNAGEQVVEFSSNGSKLVGILHKPDSVRQRGIVLVVGGPQYRIGSHRQFVLISRALSARGFPVLRFDYRGMGDSEGEWQGFEHISDDIQSAIDALYREVPTIEGVVIWGLCDAASAASFYAPADPRVEGMVLLNPWVRSEQGAARAYLKYYYLERLLSSGFWLKIWQGRFDFTGSAKSFWNLMRRAGSARRHYPNGTASGAGNTAPQTPVPLAERMFLSLKAFPGRVLLVLSGNDLTAAEFKDSVKGSRAFSRLLRDRRFTTEHLEESDHTFSRREWRNRVVDATLAWLASW
jgi:exosortase A-associated hydrolase 1/exosortase A-associated hydrolase 2